MVNATLAMGHQTDPAHCYKFHILQTNLQYTIFYNIILGLGKMRNNQDRFLAIHIHPQLGKVTLKSNYDEALCDESPLKSNGNEAFNDNFL
jgi:hypothetical protein